MASMSASDEVGDGGKSAENILKKIFLVVVDLHCPQGKSQHKEGAYEKKLSSIDHPSERQANTTDTKGQTRFISKRGLK